MADGQEGGSLMSRVTTTCWLVLLFLVVSYSYICIQQYNMRTAVVPSKLFKACVCAPLYLGAPINKAEHIYTDMMNEFSPLCSLSLSHTRTLSFFVQPNRRTKCGLSLLVVCGACTSIYERAASRQRVARFLLYRRSKEPQTTTVAAPFLISCKTIEHNNDVF